ncbi:hypothetical protein CWI36_0113p0060 [Hamiltosporidium magnivora]|uniref:Uncharacterized protein n=1 Tax=Hamiltosporidium magnivora TaxID=148818 RepID=A0A4Q9LN21_9MICR|nr:hypothetical protein CWI36_0764p0020 [Hamiltosporidium magnivora]TBU08640.1 hypothetical protein CWI36_0113p0060 [Hamiltosporidium magnivora]
MEITLCTVCNDINDVIMGAGIYVPDNKSCTSHTSVANSGSSGAGTYSSNTPVTYQSGAGSYPSSTTPVSHSSVPQYPSVPQYSSMPQYPSMPQYSSLPYPMASLNTNMQPSSQFNTLSPTMTQPLCKEKDYSSMCDNTSERDKFKKCVSDALRKLRSVIDNCKKTLGDVSECCINEECLESLKTKKKEECNDSLGSFISFLKKKLNRIERKKSFKKKSKRGRFGKESEESGFTSDYESDRSEGYKEKKEKKKECEDPCE